MYSHPLWSSSVGELGVASSCGRLAVPVQMVARNKIAENTVFSVYFDSISDGSGNNLVPTYLSILPKNANQENVSGVAILPVMNEKIGLIRIFRYPLGRWSWEVPKGFIEPDEQVETAALRELREETGIRVTPSEFRKLAVVAPEPGVIAGTICVYYADYGTECHPTGLAKEEIGHAEICFYDVAEVRNMILNGMIEDACTLSALLFSSVFIVDSALSVSFGYSENSDA